MADTTPTHDGPKGTQDQITDPSPIPVAVIGVIGVLSVAVLVLAVMSLALSEQNRLYEERYDTFPLVRNNTAEQEALYNAYEVVDAGSGVVKIPIDLAAEAVQRELRAEQTGEREPIESSVPDAGEPEPGRTGDEPQTQPQTQPGE
jgi:hypothetical protein